MNKRVFVIIMLVLIASVLQAATKSVVLEGLSKPGQAVYLDKENLYVVENFSILIYSRQDFKLLKKFGSAGQGPQEFMTGPELGPLAKLALDVETDKLVVRSAGKVSWYTKKGEFIKETRLDSPFFLTMIPFGKNYVTQKYVMGQTRCQALSILDSQFKEIKEISRVEDQFQEGKGLRVLNNNPTQTVYKDRLYVAWDNEMKVKVLDSNLKELFNITHPIKRKAVNSGDKDKIINFLKNDPETKQYYQYMQPITFPDYFPAILSLVVSGDKIYILTFEWERVSDELQKYETLIFDLNGKFLKKVMVPLKMQDPLVPYPNGIYEGKFYQLVENMDDETWEVHITEIE